MPGRKPASNPALTIRRARANGGLSRSGQCTAGNGEAEKRGRAGVSWFGGKWNIGQTGIASDGRSTGSSSLFAYLLAGTALTGWQNREEEPVLPGPIKGIKGDRRIYWVVCEDTHGSFLPMFSNICACPLYPPSAASLFIMKRAMDVLEFLVPRHRSFALRAGATGGWHGWLAQPCIGHCGTSPPWHPAPTVPRRCRALC